MSWRSVMARLWRWWCGSIRRRVNELLRRLLMSRVRLMSITCGTFINPVLKSTKMALGFGSSLRLMLLMWSSNPAKVTTLSLFAPITKRKMKSSQSIAWARLHLRPTSFTVELFSKKSHSTPKNPRSSSSLSPRLSYTTWKNSRLWRNSLREAACTRAWTFTRKAVT